MRLHRVAYLILATMVITCKISWASTQCKAVVMDVHMKKCRFGSRIKRDVERLDLLKHDEKFQWKGLDYFSSDVSMSPHGVPRKRQVSRRIGDITLPIVVDVINGAFSETGYYDRTSSSAGRSSGWSDYGPTISSRPLVTPFFSTAVSDDLGLDLNSEELDELYDNIYERLPRTSKEEAWKVFLETASECCQNVDRCLKEAVHVPCLAL
ncbi:PREDICTED: uncharacterized protein LOC106741670 [Dinoponera quadriceps]|uniref:Uncharacterized protein LOC106741670 n=1 Tax=Dinoponera quadriceps TaxID=609295 RepID=A0A6P3WTJ6_DINQU|nr:PREDICTED: uncharacterized protein LOC106741670 [Dinoponera quadriceps]